MKQGRNSLLFGAGAVAMLAGCAQFLVAETKAPAPKVEPVYRVQQPAGTAAGQYAVGRMELTAGRVDAAITRFRQALQLDPAFVEAHNGLGVAFGQQGRYAEAAAAFQAGLLHSPDSPLLLNNLGYAQLKAGRFDEAWAALDRSHRLDRGNPRTQENLVLLAQARAAAPGGQPMTAGVAQAAPKAAPAGGAAAASAAPQAASIEVVPVARPTISAVTQVVGEPVARSEDARLVEVSSGIFELRMPQASAAVVPVAPPPAVVVPPLASPAAAPSALPASAAVPTSGAAAPVAAPVAGFEVSNGVGTRNLAGRMARALGRLGVPVARISDFRIFGVQRTELHYRSGHQAAAQAVAESLPVSPRLLRSNRLQPDINVRLVVGRDLGVRQVAWLDLIDQGTEAADSPRAAQSSIAAAQQTAPDAQPMRLAAADASGGWRHF